LKVTNSFIDFKNLNMGDFDWTLESY
jgi:hypothetical protein